MTTPSPEFGTAARFQQALACFSAGELADAETHCTDIIAHDAHYGDAYHLLGLISFQRQAFKHAVAWIEQALAHNPGNADYHSNLGLALKRLRRFEEALASLDRAIALNPNHTDAYYNRGHVFQELRQLGAAIADYDKALTLNPRDVQAHLNRGLALKDLGRPQEARENYLHALELEPDRAETKRALFWLLFARNEDPALIQALSDDMLSYGIAPACAALRSKRTISPLRTQHDWEQTAYILERNPGLDLVARAHQHLADIRARHSGNEGDIPVSEDEVRDLAAYWTQILRLPVTADGGDCLNPENDWRAIEDAYFASTPEVVQIDNFLAPRALADMRAFCLSTTVWRKEYMGRYLGAFADGGFVSPLHLRIATELREKMPRVFGPHQLEHMWAFKCATAQDTGLNVHADFAKVNLNFWVTPDEANLDPSSGGLVVHDVPAPASWGFREYNQSRPDTIYAFLKAHNATRRAFSYKSNRAILFNSRLFHETDKVYFRDSYVHRRINITYLFGKG